MKGEIEVAMPIMSILRRSLVWGAGRVAGLSFGLLLVASLVALAEEPESPEALIEQQRTRAHQAIPPGFERVTGAPEEDKADAPTLVVLAYAAFFVGMFGYVLWLGRRQQALARHLEELAAKMNQGSPS